jgi:hypothetical protein
MCVYTALSSFNVVLFASGKHARLRNKLLKQAMHAVYLRSSALPSYSVCAVSVDVCACIAAVQ